MVLYIFDLPPVIIFDWQHFEFRKIMLGISHSSEALCKILKCNSTELEVSSIWSDLSNCANWFEIKTKLLM